MNCDNYSSIRIGITGTDSVQWTVDGRHAQNQDAGIRHVIGICLENLGVTGGFVDLSVGDGTKLLLSHFAPGMTGVENPISLKAALYGFGPVHHPSNL